MTDCLQQMAQLQAKMEVLQQEKNNKAAEEVVKQQEVEPNLRILIDWLDKYGEMIDEVERERVIMEQYNELEKDRERGSRGQGGIKEKIMKYEKIIEIENLPEGKQKWRELRNFVSQSGVGGRIDHDLLPQLRLKYEPTQEEYEFYNNREMITEKYLSLQNKKQSTKTNKNYYRGLGETRARVMCRDGNESQPHQLSRTELLSNSPNFIPGNHHPTYFMKQYIEATHNMFVIQQKRINELETIIKKIEMNST
jgi:hypothetical protein